MRVLATRRNMDDRTDADALGVELVELAELLRQSDYVSLHLPLTEESYHLLDEAAINAMKPGSYLINTARGALVDEDALAAALRRGHLAGAGIDTFSGIEIFTEEERPPEHALVDLDNVILSPHVGGLSEKATETVSNHLHREHGISAQRPSAAAGQHRQSRCRTAIPAVATRSWHSRSRLSVRFLIDLVASPNLPAHD